MNVYKKMILRLLVSGVVIIAVALCIHSNVAYAGDINGNEARVIGVASGTFEYDGETYAAASGYISQLTGYLSKDGVDLTAEQADAAISKIYANVATGVKEGYIVKVSGSGDKTDSDSGEDEAGKPTDKSDKTDKKKPAKETAVPEPTKEPTSVPQIVAKDNGMVDVYTEEGNKIATFDGVLKNTGYSLDRIVFVLGVLAMIFVFMTFICLIYIIKSKKSIARSHAVRT